MATEGNLTQQQVELVLNCSCNLGESPIYDARNDTLYFVDINGMEIHSLMLDTRHHAVFKLDEPIGCVFLTRQVGTVGVGTKRRLMKVRLPGHPDEENGHIEEIGALDADSVDEQCMRFNDGKVSPSGTALIIGHMHSKWREGHQGRLYVWSTESRQFKDVTPPGGIGLPNGMAWNSDNTAMYSVDSCAESITQYPTDSGSGVPLVDDTENTKVINALPTGHKHVPDGMAIDTSGNLWVALGDSGSVVCYDSETGEELQRVSLPVKRPTSCNFGGKDLETLFVTTRVETGETASQHHGGIFAVRIPGIRGLSPDPCLDV
ncbi:Regucalcin [Picochlorum sp. SENEW3]|nr:Regucalcin [Picochlorum sp. SENEW3]WPT15625.1 Regucalcin [Picochlorum sp. SENEW3]